MAGKGEGAVVLFNIDIIRDGCYATASPSFIFFRQARAPPDVRKGLGNPIPIETVWSLSSTCETSQLLGPLSREVTLKWFDAGQVKTDGELLDQIRNRLKAQAERVQPLFSNFAYIFRLKLAPDAVWFTRDGNFGKDPIQAVSAIARNIQEHDRSAVIQSTLNIIGGLDLSPEEKASECGWFPGREWYSPCW